MERQRRELRSRKLEFCWVARDRRSPAPARVQVGQGCHAPMWLGLEAFRGELGERENPGQKCGLCCVVAKGLEDLVRYAVETLN